jgi:hypothetical protein
MANGMTDFPSQPLLVQQFLHGYSDGHRLLSSSCPLKGRDAKTTPS